MASLFRNFLLADRIMRAASCTPASFPRLPSTHQHPMWQVKVPDHQTSLMLAHAKKWCLCGLTRCIQAPAVLCAKDCFGQRQLQALGWPAPGLSFQDRLNAHFCHRLEQPLCSAFPDFEK